ncbi:DNA methylase N-4/N-6 domain protein [Gluconacetobacter diazotrophicus PA1 5]|uniref:Methyltransferase n=2 Tax=Gluconacetobacter diazotrophicus TaxID=33996 RepID=A0A7W4FEF2_GLUDI|nr:site-specific DNA-methyltransferase [Gluconacetobacter diazotrophicus]ACI50083.1 DNA methylase N-4/N-6 domain protein [Gluconacetobacter diazotrophicus PA1 5]MBB2156223.1 site-specific DNA-methyltransferase [Gluconacetobacter diazotrophicus]TWB07837.1 site-specific DNA-methyltransferase (adenine-specific) [Gluconacetobacter diazotrophicus]CAP56008.1 putative modification methylase MjaV [Gluconacetobacter diazotrophicus PA1 5]
MTAARAPRTLRYAIGPHQLVRGDCLRVLRRMDADSVDVVVTSPPYNIGLGYRTYSDRMSETQYLDWMMAVARELHRVMRPDGSFFLNIAGSSAQPWIPFELAVRLREIFHLQNHISWIKSVSVNEDTFGHFKPVNSARYLHRNHEHLFHLTRSGTVELNRLDIGVPYKDKSNIARRGHEQDRRCRGDTWFIPYETVQGKAQKFNHPGTFPVQLPRMCIRLHGRPGAVVLDPFMGTGTTLVAAQEEGARAIGIDLDTAYVTVARDRLTQAMK